MELSAILPLPASVADNPAAAFTSLAGLPTLLRTVDVMLRGVGDPRRVVVAAAGSIVDSARESLVEHGLPSVTVVAATGPSTRGRCLRAGLDQLRDGGLAPTHVLIHDIAQPLVSADVQSRVVGGLRAGGIAVIPARVVTDSVKAVDTQGVITRTVDRSMLRAVQYPWGLDVHRLDHLLASAADQDVDALDEVVLAGLPISVVDGEPDGFRADLPRDAPFVEAIIASRQHPRGR